MVCAILIARKGSKGLKRKNMLPIGGYPMAYYPLKAGMDCPEIDTVYVSTDDDELKELAGKNKTVLIERTPELCTDAALGEDVYVHAYECIKNKNKDIELLVLLMGNAPIITAKMISEGIRVLRLNPEYDSAVSVSRYNMWSPLRARRIGGDGLLHPFVPFETLGDPKTLNCDRDSQGDVWFADMGVSIVRARCLENIQDGILPQKWMGRKIYPLKQWGGLDIDYEWQIPQARYWLKKHGFAREGE